MPLISLNPAPTPKKIFLMIIERHILIIWRVSYKSLSNSRSVQVLHQQLRRRWGVKACADNADVGGAGVQNQRKLADVILEHSLTSSLSSLEWIREAFLIWTWYTWKLPCHPLTTTLCQSGPLWTWEQFEIILRSPRMGTSHMLEFFLIKTGYFKALWRVFCAIWRT